MHLIFYYCLSENKSECARLKQIKNGENVSKYILQDGTRFKSEDILTEHTYH